MPVLDINQLAAEVFDIEADAILNLKNKLGFDFDKAVELLYNSKGKVIITGMGKSGLIGKKIAATLTSTGTPSYFLHPAESTHGDSGIITREDVVIAISNSGETQELLNLLPLIKRFDVPIISMTGGQNSTLAKAGDVVLDIGVEKEACPLGKAPTASTTATLAMGDALAVCLLKKRGFSEEDFLVYHPGGALGKGIRFHVRDLMLTGEKLPIASEDVLFTDLIKLISEYKLGLAILVDREGKLSGILTDGDIRRIVIKHHTGIDNIKAADVMTKSPKTLTEDAFAASALNLMERYSITSLAVVDSNNIPTGVIHIHDLLRAGVA